MTIRLCFFLSGVTALCYQTLWARLFATSFGTSEYAISAVIASCMAGLGIGAWLITKHLHRIRSPTKLYALLEFAVCGWAFAIPELFELFTGLYTTLLTTESPPPATIGATTLTALLTLGLTLPVTIALGATLPLLVRADGDNDVSVSSLYFINTLGAGCGALIGVFLLIPIYGLTNGLYLTGLTNGFIGLLALLITHTGHHEPTKHRFTFTPLLVVSLISGLVSFAFELIWFRCLALHTSNHAYAFGVMLAIFLFGIAIGARVSTHIKRPRLAFAFSQTLIIGTATYCYLGFFEASTLLSAIGLMALQTLAFGIAFPMLVRICEGNSATNTGTIYAWNTIGAIIGALLGGFVLLPLFNFHHASAILGLLSIGLFLWSKPPFPFRVMVGALPVALLITTPPPRPLFEDTIAITGHTSTVFVSESPQGFGLHTNNLTEGFIARIERSPLTFVPQHLLGLLGPLFNPNAERMLIAGYGAGAMLEAIPNSVRTIDVVELEQAVIKANTHVSAKRRVNPLEDERIHIIHNDARNALARSTAHYDIIVSQPSHPWTPGAAHLFTTEYFESVRSHLSTNGVFVVWMAFSLLNESMLRSVFATLNASFPFIRAYHAASGTLYFVASEHPLEPQFGEITPIHTFARLETPTDLESILLFDEATIRELGKDHRLITDDHNIMAFSSRPSGDQALRDKIYDLSKQPKGSRDMLWYRYQLGLAHWLQHDGSDWAQALTDEAHTPDTTNRYERFLNALSGEETDEPLMALFKLPAPVLATLDANLTHIPTNEPWAGLALLLRAQWRIALGTELDKASELTDRSLIRTPWRDGLLTRIQLALINEHTERAYEGLIEYAERFETPPPHAFLSLIQDLPYASERGLLAKEITIGWSTEPSHTNEPTNAH